MIQNRTTRESVALLAVTAVDYSDSGYSVCLLDSTAIATVQSSCGIALWLRLPNLRSGQCGDSNYPVIIRDSADSAETSFLLNSADSANSPIFAG